MDNQQKPSSNTEQNQQNPQLLKEPIGQRPNMSPSSTTNPPKSGIMYEQNNALPEDTSIFDRLIRGPVLKIIGILLFITILIFGIFRFVLPLIGGTNGEITLVYWGIWEEENTMSTIFKEFEASHPNVIIKYEKQDVKTLGKYIDRLTTRVANGTGPDLFRYHQSWLPTIRNTLAPMPTDVVKSINLETSYYETIKSDLSRNGAYYGVPIGIDTLALFVNTQLFEAAGITEYPETWDDFVRVSRTLTVRDDTGGTQTAGAALGGFDNVAHASDIVSLLMVQNGADMMNLSGSRRKNAEDALEFYASFINDENKVWDESMDNSKLAFAKGNLAMYFGYSWDIFEIKKANPDLQFKIVSVPHVSGVNPNRDKTIASYWVEGVSIKSKYSKEAFELMKFMAQKESLEKLYTASSKTRLFGAPYPRHDMKELLKGNELVYPFVSQADRATTTIFPSDTHDEGSVSILNGYLSNAVRSVAAGTSPQSAVDTLSQGVAQVIQRYE